jgi:hypothetical protein
MGNATKMLRGERKEGGSMRRLLVCIAIVCILASSTAMAIEKRAYQMREDYGTAPLDECALQYYYYVPCPTYSWFWAFTGWEIGDVIGEWFEIGDLSTGGFGISDPVQCHTLEQIRVLDFAGYGTTYPWNATVEFDVYCCDSYGCPIGPSLWNSGPVNTGYAWNLIVIDPPISVCPCAVDPGPPPSAPRVLVTATHVDLDFGDDFAWGADNISSLLVEGCIMHDLGCLPVLYPRPYTSHHPTMHSGYYGRGFEYCPPQWFKDKNDTTADGSQYGFVELAWRIYMVCSGPTETRTSTWSDIKSMYR